MNSINDQKIMLMSSIYTSKTIVMIIVYVCSYRVLGYSELHIFPRIFDHSSKWLQSIEIMNKKQNANKSKDDLPLRNNYQ